MRVLQLELNPPAELMSRVDCPRGRHVDYGSQAAAQSSAFGSAFGQLADVIRLIAVALATSEADVRFCI